MTVHDKLLSDGRAKRSRRSNNLRLMLDGASTITLWPRMRRHPLGDVGDDWKAVGDELRRAMHEEARR